MLQEGQDSLDTTASMFPCLLLDTVTITEATQLEITVLQLKHVTTLTCHRLREEQEQLAMSTTCLSGTPYYCYPPTQLPQ